jgi:hypothetical protein
MFTKTTLTYFTYYVGVNNTQRNKLLQAKANETAMSRWIVCRGSAADGTAISGLSEHRICFSSGLNDVGITASHEVMNIVRPGIGCRRGQHAW